MTICFRSRSLAHCVLFVALICLVCVPAQAQRRRNPVKGLAGVGDLIPGAGADVLSDTKNNNALTRLRYSTRIPGLGRVKLRFNRIRKYAVEPTITRISDSGSEITPGAQTTLLRGLVKIRGEKRQAAGSIFIENGTAVLTTSFMAKRRSGIEQYYSLEVPLPENAESYSAQYEKVSRLGNKTRCANDENKPFFLPPDPSLFGADDLKASASQRVLEVSAEGDAVWAAILGGSASSRIQTLINNVESIYEEQLGVTFDVTRLNVYQSRTFGTSDAETMVRDYGQFILRQSFFGQADVYHLFTGTDFDGGTVGVAGTGALCILPSFSIGANQGVYYAPNSQGQVEGFTNTALTTVVFAHELGHNFGALHTSSGIMTASVGDPLPTTFSSESLTEINRHIDTFGFCLSEEDSGDPTPTPDPDATPDPDNPDPDPTATPGGGGGSGGGVAGEGRNVELTMNASLSRAGEFSLSMTLADLDPSCEVRLRHDGKRLKSISGKILAIIPVTAFEIDIVNLIARYNFSTTLNKATQARSRKGKKSGGFLAADIRCDGGGLGQADPVRIRPEKIKAKKGRKKLFMEQYMRKLGKKLKQSLTETE